MNGKPDTTYLVKYRRLPALIDARGVLWVVVNGEYQPTTRSTVDDLIDGLHTYTRKDGD